MLAQVPHVGLIGTMGYGLWLGALSLVERCPESNLQMFRIVVWLLPFCNVFYVSSDNFPCLSFFFPPSFSLSLFSQEQFLASSPTPNLLAHLATYPSSGSLMATLKVISYNVRGLCSPGKCRKLWWELKKVRGTGDITAGDTFGTQATHSPIHSVVPEHLSGIPV